MSDDNDILRLAPFPQLQWCDCDWWEGKVDLEFDRGAALSVTPYDPSVSRMPAKFQREAMAFQVEHGGEDLASILSALLPYYEELRPRYRDFLGDDQHTLIPEVQSSGEL